MVIKDLLKYLDSRNFIYTIECKHVVNINGKNCLELLYYLYENSTIYLTRKFNKYRECCRLYEELYRGLQTKNGESIKADAVLNSETKESGSM